MADGALDIAGYKGLSGTALPSSIAHALQPIIDIQSGAVYGYEALLRGTGDAGFASIDAFFDAVHASGQLLQTELALYQLVFASTRRLPHAKPKKIFVNIDNRIFSEAGFDAAAIAAIADYMGVHRSSVCLEISEKHSNVSRDNGLELVRQLRAEGLRLALDDFGQGFSELKLLYQASPDYVKIDRFFITDIDKTPRKRLFLSTVVNIAHVLGAKVVAEGIETAEEFAICRKLGCDLAQGYFIAHPTRDLANLPNIYPLPAAESNGMGNALDMAISASLIDPLAPLDIETGLNEALSFAGGLEGQTIIPAIDDSGEALGLIEISALRKLAASPSRTASRHLREILIRTPTLERDSTLRQLLDTASSSECREGLLITQDYEYLGFISPGNLLKAIQESRVFLNQEFNRLSNLPGYSSINDYVLQQSANIAADRIFCYLDFNHFKPFNDCYGFRQGDRCIRLFSDILRRYMTLPGAFLAHSGGDDFFVGVESDDIAQFERIAAHIQIEFRTQVESFYAPEDRDRGFLRGHDRENKAQIFPMITCSAVIMAVPKGSSFDPTDLFTRWTVEGRSTAKISPSNRALRVIR